MKQNLYGGKFIVFEGLDGSGQSTQASLLKDYFLTRGKEVISTKEPTQWTEAGKKIKTVLEEKISIEPLRLQELFVQDRDEHLREEIIPALRAGKIVICDRYFFSTLAFGGIGVPMLKLKLMNKGFLYPDMTFYLKVRPEVCVERIDKRGEGVRFFEKLEKLKKVAQNYEKIIESAKQFPNVVAIDGEKSIKEIHQEIVRVCLKSHFRRETF